MENVFQTVFWQFVWDSQFLPQTYEVTMLKMEWTIEFSSANMMQLLMNVRNMATSEVNLYSL